MVLDPIPQSLPVQFFGSRPQPPTSPLHIRMCKAGSTERESASALPLYLFKFHSIPHILGIPHCPENMWDRVESREKTGWQGRNWEREMVPRHSRDATLSHIFGGPCFPRSPHLNAQCRFHILWCPRSNMEHLLSTECRTACSMVSTLLFWNVGQHILWCLHWNMEHLLSTLCTSECEM